MDSPSTLSSSRNKEERLHRRREWERARRAAETAGRKERRLKQRRERDRARRAAQSVEQRQVRLHMKSATERKRQAAETPDHREARMEGWRAAQQERLAAETAEEREQNDRDGTVNALFRQKCWSFIVRLHHWVGHSSKFKVYISWTHMGIEITKANV